MKVKTFIVDAFTNERFKGNPAGVCLLNENLDDHLMLSIAKELGLSETAFVQAKQNGKYSIRYFSPKMEIPLCGHATLASSKVMFDQDIKLEKIHFINIQNLDLIIEKSGDDIKMLFPAYYTEPATAPNALIEALGIDNIKNCEYNKETNVLILEIEDSDKLRKLKPDYEALYKSHSSIKGVLVTAISNKSDFDFESRYFWPWSGTNEDPVTGGSHTFLTTYWSKRLEKTKMRSFQCSERSGFMEVELIDANHITITSTAQIILEGNLII